VSALRIGFNPDFAPFAALQDGRADGLVIARLRNALDKAGLEATFVPAPLPEMAERLQAGALDALAGVAVSAERSDALAVSRPLATTGGAWFPRAERDWPRDQALRTAAPGTLRVVSPSAGPLVAQIRTAFPTLDIVECADYAAAFETVLAGRADAAALNLQVGRLHAERDHPGRFKLPETPFFEVPLALAVPHGDPLGILRRLDPHIDPL